MGCGSWVGFKVLMVCGVVLVVGINFGGCGLLLVVVGDGYLAVICSMGWDLAGFGFGISVWCYNGEFGGLVWCFRGGSGGGGGGGGVWLFGIFGWLVRWCWCEFGC